jgi:predicted NUDIX family NTP pyrophosphohydrolase
LLLFRREAGVGSVVSGSADAGAGSGSAGADAASQAEVPIEVLIALPGGPLYRRRDEGWWTVPKGEHGDDEQPLVAASREFAEELGTDPPAGEPIDLGSITQRGGKVVRAWALEGDLDTSSVVSNEFEIEWPPRSGVRRRYPEIARAEWVSLAEARRKLLASQVPFVDRLEAVLAERPSA